MKIKLAVIFGGKSVEHEISIISAHQAIEAIDNSKYEVIPIYISKKGEWRTGKILYDIKNFSNLNNIINNTKKIDLINDKGKIYIYERKNPIFSKRKEIDIAFPIVHGTNVEDGTLQGYLKTLDIPFVGSDVAASVLSQDKVFMKIIWQSFGLPVVPYIWFYKVQWENNTNEYIKNLEDNIQYPMIIKPANLGSSIGIEVVNNKKDLQKSIDKVFQYDEKILVEKFLSGFEEYNCSVLGNIEKTNASAIEKIIKEDTKDFLCYEQKYLSNSDNKTNFNGMANTKREVPANISCEDTKKIQELCIKAFNSLNMEGVSRVDCFFNGSDIYLNEINNIPGSLSFYLWNESKKNFTQLIDELINLAISRYKKKTSIISSYETNLLAKDIRLGLKTNK